MSKFNLSAKAAAIDGLMLGAMQRIARETRDYFVKNFDKQAWGKVKWAPLSPNTRNSKTEHLPILEVTGELKSSTQNSILTITKEKVLMENNATDDRGRHYSNYHNEGTPNMPARPLMKQTSELTELQRNILLEETGKVWTRV